MKSKDTKDIARIFADVTLIERALKRAAAAAIQLHKEKGLPLVVYRDGKTVLVPADDLIEHDPQSGDIDGEPHGHA